MPTRVVLTYNFIVLLIFCYLLSIVHFAQSFNSLFLSPFIYFRLPTKLCYFEDWYYLKIVKDLYPEFSKKFSMYGYFINTSVTFPFSHQKSIIRSNFFDPLYFIIRLKKVNENLVVLPKFTLSAFYHMFSSCYWFSGITKQIPLSRFFYELWVVVTKMCNSTILVNR